MNTNLDAVAVSREHGLVHIVDVYAHGGRLVRTLFLPERQKVYATKCHILYPPTIEEYLVEREECTPNEAAKLVKFWRMNPAKIPTNLMPYYKEWLRTSPLLKEQA